MNSPIPIQPSSPVIFTDYRAESVLRDLNSQPQQGTVTPIAQDCGLYGNPKREYSYDTSFLAATNNPLGFITPVRQGFAPGRMSNLPRFSMEMSLVRDDEHREDLVAVGIAESVDRICLQASQEFIGDFRCNIEIHRPDSIHGSPSTPSPTSTSSTQQGSSGGDSLLSWAYRHARATNSLRANISTVSNIFWAQGNHCQAWCPTSESDAANDMSCIIEAAKNLMAAQHRPNYESATWMKGVLRDGMELCRCLRQHRGRAEIKRLGVEYFGADWDEI